MAQSTTTPFRADPADELPVGVQLAWRLRALIAAGRLSPGDRMPSVRALAEWADVNVNTVRGVYARLEHDGLIETRHGRGSFVAEAAEGSPEVERIAAEAIEAALDAGVDPADVAKVTLVSAALPEGIEAELTAEPEEPDAIALERLAAELDLDDSWLEADELAARRELRRQIGKLEAELAAYRRDDEPPARPRRVGDAAPRVAGTEELERTRDELLARLAAARAAAARRALGERRAREVRDEMVRDPAAHRWEVVSATEAGEEGCREWEARPWLGPLGTLMGWWRVKVSGGCPLPAPLAAARGHTG
jgi:DNA-binding transcriptional regulator YhcF (GntR family)